MHPRRIAEPNQGFIYVGDKNLKKLQKRAWEAGWWPAQKKSGILWLAPDGVGQVMLHGTASDHAPTPTPAPSSATPVWTCKGCIQWLTIPYDGQMMMAL